jgi:tRNA(Arg) A34 adenosine deaminase TadA
MQTTTEPRPEAPVLNKEEQLALFWDKPVSELATLKPVALFDSDAERHRILSLALMSLVYRYWNGNKHGIWGTYPSRPDQIWFTADPRTLYRPRSSDLEPDHNDYLGHNIAAIAVDGDGDIVDFDFNHNTIFSSTVEHAESRLVRRLFSLTQLNADWNFSGNPKAPATDLSNVTIYTSLECCAQCAGIMTLARVKEVVYLQRDFGMYCIGNILYNLTNPGPIPAPRPIPACDFDLPYYNALNDAFKTFYEQVAKEGFWSDGKFTNKSRAVTSFCCTDTAYNIYREAHEVFENMVLQHPTYKCVDTRASSATLRTSTIKSNDEVLISARAFVDRMVMLGSRGTPHRF